MIQERLPSLFSFHRNLELFHLACCTNIWVHYFDVILRYGCHSSASPTIIDNKGITINIFIGNIIIIRFLIEYSVLWETRVCLIIIMSNDL